MFKATHKGLFICFKVGKIKGKQHTEKTLLKESTKFWVSEYQLKFEKLTGHCYGRYPFKLDLSTITVL